jgi:DNA-binding NarL/FixJ family response regulator
VRPDAFIVAIDEAGGIDLDAARMAHELDPEMRVIVLSKDRSRSAIGEAFEAGADIYLLIDADPDDLVAGMKQLFTRSVFIASDWTLPRPLHEAMLRSSDGPSLTRRELEILRLVAEGHTNSSMASMLWVTEQTIKFHLTNIYRKLDVSNRTEASRWAQLRGLLSLDQPRRAADAL